MESCPDCIEVKQLYNDKPEYELIDIGQQARNLKEFLVLRDNHPAFAKVRERGNIGIPCFVKEDGSVIISLKHYNAALAEEKADEKIAEKVTAEEYPIGAACNLDGSGC
jgi:glutaredoxin-related protein